MTQIDGIPISKHYKLQSGFGSFYFKIQLWDMPEECILQVSGWNLTYIHNLAAFTPMKTNSWIITGELITYKQWKLSLIIMWVVILTAWRGSYTSVLDGVYSLTRITSTTCKLLFTEAFKMFWLPLLPDWGHQWIKSISILHDTNRWSHCSKCMMYLVSLLHLKSYQSLH